MKNPFSLYCLFANYAYFLGKTLNFLKQFYKTFLRLETAFGTVSELF